MTVCNTCCHLLLSKKAVRRYSTDVDTVINIMSYFVFKGFICKPTHSLKFANIESKTGFNFRLISGRLCYWTLILGDSMLCPYSVLGFAHFYKVKNGFHTIIYKFEMLTKLDPLTMGILCNCTPTIFSSRSFSRKSTPQNPVWSEFFMECEFDCMCVKSKYIRVINCYIHIIIHKPNSFSQLGTTVNWSDKSLLVLIKTR